MQPDATTVGSPTAGSPRGRGACALLGAVYFLAAIFAGGIIGVGADYLIRLLSGRAPEGWYNYEYECPPMLVEMFVVGLIVGAWLGWRSYKPAAMIAGGKRPNPPFLTNAFMHSRRRELAVFGTYFTPRWQLLIGDTNTPWRIFPRVLTGGILAAAVLLPYFLGRDSDFRLSAWVCGGIALMLADCLLVNKIAQWRTNGQLKPL